MSKGLLGFDHLTLLSKPRPKELLASLLVMQKAFHIIRISVRSSATSRLLEHTKGRTSSRAFLMNQDRLATKVQCCDFKSHQQSSGKLTKQGASQSMLSKTSLKMTRPIPPTGVHQPMHRLPQEAAAAAAATRCTLHRTATSVTRPAALLYFVCN
jgi:hypothetical protein